MDGNGLKFKEGDRLIHHYGIKGEFLQEAVVDKVYKNGNFKTNRSESQFRQSGYEAGVTGWGQEWVEPWTPETGGKFARHRLELRAISAANVFLQNISAVDSHKLEYVSVYLEDVSRKAIGETK